jgi:hypothetical protein
VIGDVGNQVVRNTLAKAVATAQAKVHLRFMFCNLDLSSISALARALGANRSLTGFTLMHNDVNFKPGISEYDPASDEAVRNELIACPEITISTWNGLPLPASVLAARSARRNAKWAPKYVDKPPPPPIQLVKRDPAKTNGQAATKNKPTPPTPTQPQMGESPPVQRVTTATATGETGRFHKHRVNNGCKE